LVVKMPEPKSSVAVKKPEATGVAALVKVLPNWLPALLAPKRVNVRS
jgi:hypothetical protein